MSGWLLMMSLAHADTPETIQQWILSRPTPAGQLTEVQRFGLSEHYARNLTQWVRIQLASHTRSAVQVFQQGTCEEVSQLQVQAPGFAGLPAEDTSGRFEGSVFRLETTGCLIAPDMATAEQVYNSSAFRTAEMPNLAALHRRGDQICLRSNAVAGVMAATNFCLTSSRMQLDNITVTHNTLTQNNTENASPIFYREEIIVFAQLSEQVAIYRMIWTRGQDIGMAGKAILQRTAGNSQSRIYRALENWMQ